MRSYRAAAVIMVALFATACGEDPIGPPVGGDVVLSAEVAHRESSTCEYRITADAADLAEPAAWVEGSVRFTDASYAIPLDVRYWEPNADSIYPGDVLVSKWLGHGSSGPQHAWKGTVTWIYARGERRDTASVTFECG